MCNLDKCYCNPLKYILHLDKFYCSLKYTLCNLDNAISNFQYTFCHLDKYVVRIQCKIIPIATLHFDSKIVFVKMQNCICPNCKIKRRQQPELQRASSHARQFLQRDIAPGSLFHTSDTLKAKLIKGHFSALLNHQQICCNLNMITR